MREVNLEIKQRENLTGFETFGNLSGFETFGNLSGFETFRTLIEKKNMEE